MAEYTLTPTQSENIRIVGSDDDADTEELCGTEMSDGSTCERPADDCGYHGD